MWAERERQGCVGNLCWTLKTAICRQRILFVPADEPDPALSRKSRGWAAIPGTQPGLHSLKEGSFREKWRWFYWQIAVRTKWSTVEIKYLSGEKWSQSRNNVSGTTNHVKHWHNASVPSVMPQPACQQMHVLIFSALWFPSFIRIHDLNLVLASFIYNRGWERETQVQRWWLRSEENSGRTIKLWWMWSVRLCHLFLIIEGF